MIKNIKKIESFVRKNNNELNWIHTQAVRPIALKLAKLENANKDVVEVAALLHDVLKTKSPLLNHAKAGTKLSEKFLKKMNFDEKFIKRVLHCIESHSSPWSKNGPMPKTIEAKVVFDADMIQQLGPFGITKHILKYKENDFNKIIKFSKNNLINYAFGLLITKSGKKIGKRKIKYVKEFFKDAELGK